MPIHAPSEKHHEKISLVSSTCRLRKEIGLYQHLNPSRGNKQPLQGSSWEALHSELKRSSEGNVVKKCELDETGDDRGPGQSSRSSREDFHLQAFPHVNVNEKTSRMQCE